MRLGNGTRYDQALPRCVAKLIDNEPGILISTAAAASHRCPTGRGEFVADEVSLLVREQPFAVRRLVARSRRLAADLSSAASVRDHERVDWTMPDAECCRCVDDPLPTGLAAWVELTSPRERLL